MVTVIEVLSHINEARASEGYGRRIDYTRDPTPALDAESAVWADELLTSVGRR